jgi:hypothetical protein
VFPLGSFREHGILIYLSKDLYIGFIKLQADKGLGRSYAGLLPFTEGLFRMGYISKEVYEEHVKKYSEPLESEKPLSPEQNVERQFLEQRDQQLKGMLEQWDLHPEPEWRERVYAFATKYADKLQSARDIVALRDRESS